jgi:uncharacterized protein YoxC
VTDWSAVLYIAGGIAALLIGIGVLIACLALAKTLGRVNQTLDVVDAQVQNLSRPIGTTLDHVGGIADTADQTLARLRGIVGGLENVTTSLTKVAELTREALSPAIVNAGATIAGVTAGLRRIVTGRSSNE